MYAAGRKSLTKAQRIIPLCLCLMAFASAPAMAQSNDVNNRIKRLENELETLNRTVYKGEKPPVSVGGAAPEIDANLDRLQRLENDVRDLTGKVEQQSHDIQQLQIKLDGVTQDSQMRLDTIEGQLRGQATSTAPQPQAQPTAPVVITPPLDPANPPLTSSDAAPQVTGDAAGTVVPSQAPAPLGGPVVEGDAASLYERGVGQIKSGDYDGAEGTFTTFIKDYPTHALTPNALYWLGETHYVRKNFGKAAQVFAKAYKDYPDGPKGADNLLKLGMSLGSAGKKSDACIALGQLKRKYPNGPAPVLTKGDQEMTSLGCPQ